MSEQWSQAYYNRMCETIKQTIVENVIDYIYRIMQETIYSSVYYQYSPTQYDRRLDSNGGLADISQFDYEINMSPNGFTINVFDDAKAVGDQKGDYLDEIIIRGDMYTWKDSQIYENQPFPRDFYQATLENLLDSGILYNIIRSSFKEKGIDVN